MVLIIKPGPAITNFDNTDVAASVAASQTVTIRTITGKGVCAVDCAGDGSSEVDMKYSLDGASDVTIANGATMAHFSIAYATSLVLKATNTNGGAARNRSGISSVGYYF